ncbi:MAG: hypothetical protein IPJ01_10150 [Micavibrio sp.]|nr:hypothetical protein [Micavibrio sp.]
MRTAIYLWVQPLVMNHERCGKDEKVFFNYILDGDYSKSSKDELDKLISGKPMTSIMDFANIDSNWNYGVLSASLTNKKVNIEFAKDLEKEEVVKKEKLELKKTEIKRNKLVHSEKPLGITKKEMEIQDNGMIDVSLPSLQIKETINFPKIWDVIERDFIGKIKEGDTVVLKDDNGNKIFEVIGGSFLNVGLADLSIYDAKKRIDNPSFFDKSIGLKGGLFIREDGSLSIGDTERTVYVTIYTDSLVKASLKLNKTLMEIINNKLLNK